MMNWDLIISTGSILLSLGIFIGQTRHAVRVLETGFARHDTWLQAIDARLSEMNKRLL